MSENKKLTALTLEELKIKQKKFKGFTSVLIIVNCFHLFCNSK